MTIERAKSELMQIYGALSPDKQRAIDTLVKIEPKTGHWIDCSNGWMCSECHRDNTYDTDFCPNCGAKMESEEKND